MDEVGSKSGYKCSICKKSFEKAQSLYGHLQIHGMKNGQHSFKCQVCDSQYESLSQLWRHRRTHSADGSRQFRCDICPDSYERASQLKYHIERDHEEKRPHCCAVCPKQFYKKSDLRTHSKIHLGVKEHSCSVCKRKFSHVSNLNRHKLTHKKEKPYSCELCGQRYNQIATLNQHLRKHDLQQPKSTNANVEKKDKKRPRRKFYCKFCGKQFHLKADLDLHKEQHAKDVFPYVCIRCKKGFARLTGISHHVCSMPNDIVKIDPAPHVDQAVLPLVEENASFCEATTLEFHETLVDIVSEPLPTASEVSVDIVPEVGQAWLVNSGDLQLIAHNEVEEDAKVNAEKRNGVFTCCECKKTYARLDSLRQHLAIHYKEYAMKCPHCEMKFAWASTLKRHLAKDHGGVAESPEVRLYKCETCDREFKSKVHRRVHIERDHLNVRNHKCGSCDKVFYAKDDLVCHMRIHTGEKPYACRICGKDFKHRSHRTRHEREVHPSQTL